MPNPAYRIPRASYESVHFVGDSYLYREPWHITEPHPELTVHGDEGQRVGSISRKRVHKCKPGQVQYLEGYEWSVELMPVLYAEGEADTEEQAVQMVARVLEMVEVMK